MVGEELEPLEDKFNWHWRNTMHPVRFFAFDERAALPLPLLLVYFRPSTMVLTMIFLIVFRALEQKGLTFPAAMRTVRQQIIGKERPGWPGAYSKKFIDRG